MPELIRLYVLHTAIGFLLSALFLAGLITFDVAGLGRLILTSDIGLMAALMIFVFQGIVLASVQFGVAVMLLGQDSDDDGQTPGTGLRQEVIPVAIPARTADTSTRANRLLPRR